MCSQENVLLEHIKHETVPSTVPYQHETVPYHANNPTISDWLPDNMELEPDQRNPVTNTMYKIKLKAPAPNLLFANSNSTT